MNLSKLLGCAAALLAAYTLMACSTPGTSSSSSVGSAGTQQPGTDPNSTGSVKEYDVTQEAAWEIAKTVFRWEGAGPIQEQRAKNYMLTSVGANALSSGTVMGAWIEPGKSGQTSKVTILMKQRFLSGAHNLTEAGFHKRFAQALTLIKQGKALPKLAPPMPI